MAATAMFFLDLFLDCNEEELLMNEERSKMVALHRQPLRIIPRVQGYMGVVERMDSRTFSRTFRVSPPVFDALHDRIAMQLTHRYRGGHMPLDPRLQVLLLLKYLSSQTSLREVGELFGVSETAAYRVVHLVSDVIVTTLKDEVIQWPNAARRQQMAAELQNVCGIPGIVGFLDGSHIRLVGKLGEEDCYINRKGFASVQLQLVVDHDLTILSAYTGWPGCTHDARVLRNSQLYQGAEAGQLFSRGEQLFGDSAYPLRDWLITPFRNVGHLTRRQVRFNRRLSAQRQCVERAIGILKGRFRLLKEVPVHSADGIVKLIMSACILHNLCLIADEDAGQYFLRNAALRPNRYNNVFRNAYPGVLRRQQLLRFV